MKPYELLAEIYDGYWGNFSKDYVPFLEDLKIRHALDFSSVIDLACGTGTLLVALSHGAKRLVGLDISPQMIKVARHKCKDIEAVELFEADFRTFELPNQFSLALCCFDAINYVAKPSELDLVLSATRRHLSDNGCFVFDAVTETHYIHNHGGVSNFTVNGVSYHWSSRYNSQQKVLESKWIFDDGTETHRQVPIEYGDVIHSATRTGFVLIEAFSSLKRSPVKDGAKRIFYVLRKND